MKPLSKSKVLAFRQCPKRLWLEIHAPELKVESEQAQTRFKQGNEVGTLARFLYDPDEVGESIIPTDVGWDRIFEATQGLLDFSIPLFEASFQADGAMCMADVLLPKRVGRRKVWHMVEVKSSTSVKAYHRDDAAFQAHVAHAAGLPLASVAVAHVDPDWTYREEGDYRGLLIEMDLTEEAFARGDEVAQWIENAKVVARKRKAPEVDIGSRCREPFECGFKEHCTRQQAQPRYPVQWLPRVQTAALKAHLDALPSGDLRDVNDDLLNPLQRRVKTCTLLGETYFDARGAAVALKQLGAHKAPLYFLDFETVQYAIPRWVGTRPYQQIPFQFSCHHLSKAGKLRHTEFLDLSGDDPSRPLAEALIDACGSTGAILAYSAEFEKARIRELAQHHPRLKTRLLAIAERIVDLLPVAQQHYYHPDMRGSWSIKSVLPCLVPSLSYEALEGVRNGGDAVAAYLAATDMFEPHPDEAAVREQLLRYCELDTYAMVKLWQVFAGREEMELST